MPHDKSSPGDPSPMASTAAAITTNIGLSPSSQQSLAYGNLAFAIGLVMNNAAATQFGMKKIEASAVAIALAAIGKAAGSGV